MACCRCQAARANQTPPPIHRLGAAVIIHPIRDSRGGGDDTEYAASRAIGTIVPTVGGNFGCICYQLGDRLFTFTRLPVEQWKSARTTNAIERLHLEFKRRIKTQCMLPSAETAAMLFWALLASGQILLRKVDGWESIAEPFAEPIDLAA